MSRYRLLPTCAQEAVLRGHCAHARYTWNLAVEQHAHWRPGRKGAPGYLEQCRQLTQARAGHPWLAAGSQTVQQQALRDFAAAMAAFFDPGNPAGRPTWRKAGRDEGFRIVGRVEKINPAYTSRTCSGCGHRDPEPRESQSRSRCRACSLTVHADVNAARNIAAGHAVTARGGDGIARPVNREPQLLASLTGRRSWNPPPSGRGGCQRHIPLVGPIPLHRQSPWRARRW
jgi:Putative transposase DNA-binding domain/Helix-turn-helix domain